MTTRILAAVAAIFLLIVPANAGENFTTADIENFIKVSEAMEALEDRYPDLGDQIEQDFSEPDAFAQMINDNGELSAFQFAFSKIPAGPARTDIQKIITQNGFSSIDSFASKGDKIMMAYLALNMEGEDLSEIEAMDDATLAMMPPQFRDQMNAIKRMIMAVQKVPASDVETLRPMMSKFEAALDN